MQSEPGISAQQPATLNPSLVSSSATTTWAGGRGDQAGFSPLLEGDDDAVVRVEETKLDGAHDFLVVPVHHAAMLRAPAVQRATESFLKAGRFAPPDPAAATP